MTVSCLFCSPCLFNKGLWVLWFSPTFKSHEGATQDTCLFCLRTLYISLLQICSELYQVEFEPMKGGSFQKILSMDPKSPRVKHEDKLGRMKFRSGTPNLALRSSRICTEVPCRVARSAWKLSGPGLCGCELLGFAWHVKEINFAYLLTRYLL